MKLKAFLDWNVRFWWLYPVATILLSVLAIVVIDHLVEVALVLCGLAVAAWVMQLPVLVLLLVRRKWWQSFGALLAAGISLVVCVAIPMLLLSMALESNTDDFGQRHPIPEGMEYNLPLGGVTSNGDTVDYVSSGFAEAVAPVIDSADSSTWLQVWYGEQDGMYSYSLYWPSLADGEVYLRCFEATENIELSARRLRRRSAVPVAQHQAFGLVADHEEFTIYEGDWGDYYAVRVEVWHQPLEGSPHKLTQKTYRMDGWMR